MIPEFIEDLENAQKKIRDSGNNPNTASAELNEIANILHEILDHFDLSQTKERIEDLLSFAMMYDEGVDYSGEIASIIEECSEEADQLTARFETIDQ